jgi:maltose O-acetyltransferase
VSPDGGSRERMTTGNRYFPGDAPLPADRARCQALLRRADEVTDYPARNVVLAELLGLVGTGVEVQRPFFCDYGYNVRLGDRVFINAGAYFLDAALITLGADTRLGPGVQLLTPDHPREAVGRRTGVETARPITLGDNVWLGGGVVVCPGVTIGDDAIVGAGSVVTGDIPAGATAVGNPCRVIGTS